MYLAKVILLLLVVLISFPLKAEETKTSPTPEFVFEFLKPLEERSLAAQIKHWQDNGEFDKALKLYDSAILDHSGSKQALVKLMLKKADFLAGYGYAKPEDTKFDQAEEAYRRALELVSKQDETLLWGQIQRKIGRLLANIFRHYDGQSYALAEIAFLHALEIADTSGNRELWAEIGLELAEVNLAQAAVTKSVSYLFKSEKLLLDIRQSFPQSLMKVFHQSRYALALGQVYFELGEQTSQNSYYQTSIEVYENYRKNVMADHEHVNGWMAKLHSARAYMILAQNTQNIVSMEKSVSLFGQIFDQEMVVHAIPYYFHPEYFRIYQIAKLQLNYMYLAQK